MIIPALEWPSDIEVERKMQSTSCVELAMPISHHIRRKGRVTCCRVNDGDRWLPKN